MIVSLKLTSFCDDKTSRKTLSRCSQLLEQSAAWFCSRLLAFAILQTAASSSFCFIYCTSLFQLKLSIIMHFLKCLFLFFPGMFDHYAHCYLLDMIRIRLDKNLLRMSIQLLVTIGSIKQSRYWYASSSNVEGMSFWINSLESVCQIGVAGVCIEFIRIFKYEIEWYRQV